jgi:hypothetical protein
MGTKETTQEKEVFHFGVQFPAHQGHFLVLRVALYPGWVYLW